MLRIRNVLFIVFGIICFVIFYIELLNFLSVDNKSLTLEYGSIGSLFAIIVVSAGVIMSTFYISHKIAKPIEELDQLMMNFSKTRKKVKINSVNTQIKEIHQLQSNFEDMTQTVEKAFSMEQELITKLKKIDKQKGEFMSMISHELKTPLVIINGYTTMLKSSLLGKLNPTQIDGLNSIYESTKTLEKLIGDILIAQKLDLGELRFNFEEIDIRKFFESHRKNFIPVVKEKKIKFENSCNENVTLVCDKMRLSQVFSNIVRNSIDFVPEKDGVIKIGATDNLNSVTFYVKDNGIGIPKDKQEKIFKRFYQVDASARRKRTGSGLGLSISKSLVEGLGGKIWVESQPRHGSSFYFEIPKIHATSSVKTRE